MASPITHWLRRAPLGSGSFGKVSLAINLDNGVYFAVKSIQRAGSAMEESALESELAILQSLHSPRILRCLGADFSSGSGASECNLFLEYMEGGSIAELIKKSGGCLDEKHARYYTRAIAEGLAYLHDQEIVHCDIKGQNILVGSCGVKIADFGAAKKLSAEADSRMNGFKGTPLWMAPEVVRGDEQGCESDIWSLGCTVVEMLQGRPPWGTESSHDASSATSHVAEILLKIGYSSESPHLPDIASADCRDFLSRALERDPNLRWTATELLEHPWLQEVESIDSYGAQLSPRSAMDFPASDSDMDDEHDTWGSFARNGSPQREHALPSNPVDESLDSTQRVPERTGNPEVCRLEKCEVLEYNADDACIPDEDVNWITIRCLRADVGQRLKPFTKKTIGARVLRRRVEEVNFDSLAFLQARRISMR